MDPMVHQGYSDNSHPKPVPTAAGHMMKVVVVEPVPK
jgi:hypothetical protein